MVEIGDEFIIDGEKGIVFFIGNYYDDNYVCMAFEKEKKFEIYKCKIENDRYFFSKEDDEKKRAYILGDLISDEIIKRTSGEKDESE